MVEMAPACDVVAEEGGLAGQVQRQEDRGKRLEGTRAAPVAPKPLTAACLRPLEPASCSGNGSLEI